MIKYMDAVVVEVSYQDPALTVCSDAPWFKWILGREGRISVSKAEFASHINHYYFTIGKVSHTDF